jgi:hypothetical protein
MAHIVVLGAGLGGMPMAYEMRELARRGDLVTVVSNGPRFHFVPSNPSVGVNWRTRQDIELDLGASLQRKGIDFVPVGAKPVHPAENRIELDDGNSIGYDFLVIATGPKLAFDEIPGLGPGAWGLGPPAATRGRSAMSTTRSRPRRAGRRRVRRAAADSAAQRELVRRGEAGARGQGRLREILPAQDEVLHDRAPVRRAGDERDGHHEAQALMA